MGTQKTAASKLMIVLEVSVILFIFVDYQVLVERTPDGIDGYFGTPPGVSSDSFKQAKYVNNIADIPADNSVILFSLII